MLTANKFDNIYLYRPFADFRKGISGLCALVQDELELNLFENYLFIFCNTRRDRVKFLYWDQTRFALWYKVLEKDKFYCPSHVEAESIEASKREIFQFLQGLDPWQEPHQKLSHKIA
jgi:transposase